jgi:FMN reductase
LSDWRPVILGLGGSTRDGSTSERALRLALSAAERQGADVEILVARDLELAPYAPEHAVGDPRADALIDLLATADGLIVVTPGFHGGPSGLIKNALDYAEALRSRPRPYLDGRAVACVVCAGGWQTAATTLVALRSSVHALRGWPTPLGVTINTADEAAYDPVLAAAPKLELAATQVVEFARWRRAAA